MCLCVPASRYDFLAELHQPRSGSHGDGHGTKEEDEAEGEGGRGEPARGGAAVQRVTGPPNLPQESAARATPHALLQGACVTILLLLRRCPFRCFAVLLQAETPGLLLIIHLCDDLYHIHTHCTILRPITFAMYLTSSR